MNDKTTLDGSGFQRADFAHAGKGAADMGNGNGAADDKGDVQSVDDFFALPAFLAAADEVVSDAIVAAENGGGDEAEKFFRFGVECAGLVSLMIEGEEAFDAEVAAVEDFFVKVGAELLKIVEAIGHESSGIGGDIMD
jgi:hypothetical protein